MLAIYPGDPAPFACSSDDWLGIGKAHIPRATDRKWLQYKTKAKLTSTESTGEIIVHQSSNLELNTLLTTDDQRVL